MTGNGKGLFSKLYFWLIRAIGVIVPRRLRADWRQEWEAELQRREMLLARWNKLDWHNKLDLVRRSLGAFWDALWLQPQRWEDEMIQDLRFGVRMLLRRKGFTLVAVMSLALGIGANTAIFSIVDSILLRPLPYRSAERLVKVLESKPQYGQDRLPVSLADYYEWKSQAQNFEEMCSLSLGRFRVTGGDAPEEVIGNRVSVNFFSFLGVEAALGRTFLPDDEKLERGQVTVLSHKYWINHFNADPGIIGKKILLNDQPHVVVGVLPASFRESFESSPGRAQLWTPAVLTPEVAAYRGPGGHTPGGAHLVIARLKSGATMDQVRAEMAAIARRLGQIYPQSNKNVGAAVYSLHEEVTQSSRKTLLMLLAAFALVLLIACANVASMLLGRGIERSKEIAVRTAIGAGRLRVMRQLLTECFLLSLLGGIVGFLVAQWVIAGIAPLIPPDIPRADQITLDHRALLFTLALALFTSLLFGLLPAWQTSKINLTEVLKEAGRTSSESRPSRWWRHSLVIGQIALTMILLAGAGLMTNSVVRLYSINPGFDTHNLLAMGVRRPRQTPAQQLSPLSSTDGAAEEWNSYWNPLLEQVRRLPGVQGAAFVSGIPLEGSRYGLHAGILGRTTTSGELDPVIRSDTVSRDYFQLLGITLLQGRYFTDDDRPDRAPAVIVNESFARTFFPHQQAIGQSVIFDRGGKREKIAEIVGVVADARTSLGRKTEPHLFLFISQFSETALTLVARTASNPANFFGALRSLALSFNPNQPAAQPVTMDEIWARNTVRPRFYLSILGSLAGLALLLATTGIYGALFLSVSQRTHEIGIRRALGAQDLDVLELVLRQGMILALSGLSAGLMGALALTHYIRGWLFEVSPTDPLTFFAVAVLLVLVTLFACYSPARRAVKVDPLVSLRHE